MKTEASTFTFIKEASLRATGSFILGDSILANLLFCEGGLQVEQSEVEGASKMNEDKVVDESAETDDFEAYTVVKSSSEQKFRLI